MTSAMACIFDGAIAQNTKNVVYVHGYDKAPSDPMRLDGLAHEHQCSVRRAVSDGGDPVRYAG